MEAPTPESSADDTELLQTYLARHDAACPACEYNLRNLQSSRCPECGEFLVLQVRLAEAKQAAPIAGLIGLSAGAGFNALLLLYVLLTIFVLGRMPPSAILDLFVIVNVGGLLISILLTFFWLRRWRKIRMMSPLRRWTLVCGCWIVSLINLLVFTASIH